MERDCIQVYGNEKEKIGKFSEGLAVNALPCPFRGLLSHFFFFLSLFIENIFIFFFPWDNDFVLLNEHFLITTSVESGNVLFYFNISPK